MKPLLKIEKLSKSFGEKKVLKNLSLEVFPGDVIGLIGRSGCGKSTLLKILVGYYKADSGKIFFDGKEISKTPSAIKDIVGYTTQENAFYDKLTVFENMQYYANLYGISDNLEKHIKSLLKSVGLLSAKDKLAEDISGGMKRRLDFAISIIHNPKILILDEPTAGLDPILIDEFWKIVKKVTSDGKKAVIMTSHILGEIQQNCNKAAVMKDGRILTMLKTKKISNLEDKFRELLLK